MSPSADLVDDAQAAGWAGWGVLVSALQAVLARPWLFGVVAAVVFGFGAVSTVRSRGYVAWSSLTPEGGSGGISQLAGLALQFGINMGASGGPIGDPVRFYQELLVSRDILEEVARTRFRFPSDPEAADTVSATLVDILKVSGETERQRLQAAVKALRNRIEATTARDAGLVRLRTIAPSPDLAEQMNRRLLDLVERFNVERRQSQASGRRKFIESRLAVAEAELQRAEEAERAFLEENRVRATPGLQMMADRLRRDVDLRQQVYTQLAVAYDEARIDEVRNTPVVTIVEAPEGSARRTGGVLRDLLVWGILAAVLGLGAVGLAASWRSYWVTHSAARDALQASAGRAVRRLAQR